MTVQTNTSTASFAGNGTTTVFPIGFKFNSPADLVVELINNATGVAVLQVFTVHYVVAGAGDDAGGTLTMLSAPATGYTLQVRRVVPILQLTDLRNQGAFFAETHEDVFDRLIMIDQQQQDEIGAMHDVVDAAAATAAEMVARQEAFEMAAGYVELGAYAAGLVITSRNQVFLRSGEFYRAAAGLALPYTTSGVWASESSSFVAVGDAVLRQDLAGASGADAIGFGGTTVADYLRDNLPSVERFGITPDGVTNWESSPSVDWAGFWAAAVATGVRWPAGYYATGLNFSSAYSGARMHFDSGAILGGVFHLISSESAAQVQIASIARSANVVTVTTSGAHGFATGAKVAVRNVFQAYVAGMVDFNVENVAATVVNSTTLTFAQTGPDATGTVAGSALGTAYLYPTPLADVQITGTLTTTDRFGTINCKNCVIERVHVLNDPARHSAAPGQPCRGAHLYVGTSGLRIDELIIDYASGDNTAAALAMDGQAWNPDSCSFGRVWIKDAAYNGAYITGQGHSFGELRIDGFGKEAPNGAVLQESNGLAQTNQFKGFWTNRALGLTITRLITNQRVQDGTRFYDDQHALIDQTGDPNKNYNYGGMYTGVHIGTWIANNVRRRGICFGDDATYDSLVMHCRVDVLEVRIAPEGLTAGEFLVSFKGSSSMNRASVGLLRLQDTLSSLGVSVGSLASVRIGELQAIQHNLQILKSAGVLEVGSIFGRTVSTGFSADPLILLTSSSSAGNKIGSIDLAASSAKAMKVLEVNAAVNWSVGAIKARNYYHASGTLIVAPGTGSWALGELDLVGPSASGVGIQFAGTIANGRLNGGRVSGFATGLAKGSASFTAGSNAAVGVTVTGNTANTDLVAASFDKLACSGVTL